LRYREEDAIADPDVIFERTGIPNHYVLMLPKNGVVLCFDGLRDRPAVVSRIIANEAWYEAPLINIRKFFDKKQLGDTLVIADI
jgi:hypothetical protein